MRADRQQNSSTQNAHTSGCHFAPVTQSRTVAVTAAADCPPRVSHSPFRDVRRDSSSQSRLNQPCSRRMHFAAIVRQSQRETAQKPRTAASLRHSGEHSCSQRATTPLWLYASVPEWCVIVLHNAVVCSAEACATLNYPAHAAHLASPADNTQHAKLLDFCNYLPTAIN